MFCSVNKDSLTVLHTYFSMLVLHVGYDSLLLIGQITLVDGIKLIWIQDICNRYVDRVAIKPVHIESARKSF